MHDIIRIDHLSKRFGEVQAVQDLSFRVKEGELFAFLGVNGAGKSNTINILCGQLAKDGGSVEIDGADPDRDPDRVRRELGVVFQNSVLDGALSVRDNLQSGPRSTASGARHSRSGWRSSRSCWTSEPSWTARSADSPAGSAGASTLRAPCSTARRS